jgi:hypothetical protein
MPRTADLKGLDEVCIQFLAQQKHSTQATYKCFLKKALEFTGLTGQQLLESKKADKENQWEKKIIDFKQWLKGQGYSDNAIKTAINTLRSFFECYRTPLQFSQSENRKLNGRAQRVTKDFELTNEDISKMNLVGNLREKYILLLGKSFGLRVGDFTALTYGVFRSINLDQEPPIPIGEIQTEKEGVTAYPFIDSDSLPILKAVLDCNKNKLDTERIITVQEAELSSILQTLADKASIKLGGKHLRFHCLRKYLVTRLSASMSESKWKQIVGKSTPEEAYVNRFDLKECYLKAMELTTVNKNGNGKVSRLSEEIAELSKKVNSKETIINALVQDSTKKDHELEKQSQEIHELKLAFRELKKESFSQIQHVNNLTNLLYSIADPKNKDRELYEQELYEDFQRREKLTDEERKAEDEEIRKIGEDIEKHKDAYDKLSVEEKENLQQKQEMAIYHIDWKEVYQGLSERIKLLEELNKKEKNE